MGHFSTTQDVWEEPLVTSVPGRPLYICISGNSGAGKSTLVTSVAKLLSTKGATIAIDEKNLHHPLIANLFLNPAEYAYYIQLNFMLQRVMLVQHWLDQNYHIIMERSHLEDVIFIKHLRRLGCVSDTEYRSYLRLWEQLNRRLRTPDLVVFLDVSAETSIRRITEDELKGRRAEEFPDEQAKRDWITSWHDLYKERFKKLYSSCATKIVTVPEDADRSGLANYVLSQIAD